MAASPSGGGIDIVINAMTEKFNKNMKSLQNTVNSSASKISGLGKAVIGLGAAYAGISGLKSFAEDILKTRMEYEKMEAALSATVGPENSEKVFKSLQQFAKDTPFTLDQVTESYQRLVNLGLNPSKDAMLAYGNIAAGIPNKSITDFIEAVADAVTGENERLKEFGIKASKSGDMVSYTFQGVTKTFKGTKENIEEYLQSVGKSFANGQALSNQAATMSGRLSALGDTYDQLKNNIAKSSGASDAFGVAIESITEGVQYLSDLFESNAISDYIDAFKTSMQPVVDLFMSLKNMAQGTALAKYFEGPTVRVKDLFNEISNLWSKCMDLVSLFTEMMNNGTLTDIWNASLESLKPLWDMMVDLVNYLKTVFVDSFNSAKNSIKEVWDNTSDIIKKPIEDAWKYIKSLFVSDDSDVNGKTLAQKLEGNITKIPAYIKRALYNALAEFKYFRDVAIAYVNAVITTVKEFSTDAGSDMLTSSLSNATKKYNEEIAKNQKEYEETTKKIVENNNKVKKSLDEARKASEKKREEQKKQIETSKKEAKVKLDNLKADQEVYKNTDVAGDIGKQIVADQLKNGAGQSTPATKKSSKKENSEYKKLLDEQMKLLESSFKKGEMSSKTYYDKLLSLKLAQIKKEDNAVSQQYQNNLNIIASTTSNESEKKKAIEDNISLQKNLNGMTEEEKNIRLDIANQLSASNKEFLNNMQSIQSALNDMMNSDKTQEIMDNFENQYSEMRERIKNEDAENGTNFLPKLDQLQALTKATAEISEKQRQLNILEAQYAQKIAETQLEVSKGNISVRDGKQQELELNDELNRKREDYLQSEINIAELTEGYDEEKIARLREQLALQKKLTEDTVKDSKGLADELSKNMETFFDTLIDGSQSAKDAVKSLLTDMSKSIVSELTKGWREEMSTAIADFVKEIAKSDFIKGIGDWFSGMFSSGGAGSGSGGGGFGGFFATGGVMKPNTYNVVGENGPEVVYNGSRPTSVMNNSGYNKLNSNSGSGSTFINMNITTKDANSMRQSSKQLMLETQKEANRQINRNT